MKLLEFFGQINELRGRIFTKGDGPIFALYGTSGAGIPSHIFVSADGSDLEYADDIYALNIQPNNLKKLKREIMMKQARGQASGSDEAYMSMIQMFEQLSLTGDQIRSIGKHLPAKIVELNGRPRIYKYLTTDLGLPVQVYLDGFGQPPEMGEDEFVQFHNARLFVPDTMKPNNVKAATNTLEIVYQHLDRAGEVEVFGGDIRFIKLPHHIGGQYSLTNDNIVVNQNMKGADADAVYSLIHEYGHKKMHTSMDRATVKEIEGKYMELLGSGESYMADLDYASAVLDATSKFEVGQQLHYRGRQKQYARDPDYVIKSIDTNRSSANLARASDPNRVMVEYPLYMLLNPKKWESEGMDLTPPKEKLNSEQKSDGWFPTEYSQSESHEWWAEMYAFYILGNLSGEPAAWMRGMLHGNTTETVGSTEGEINSDDEAPPPEPERGNEEGHAEWDWTDPYHSSGTENAVMSNTP
jgi:hypothetical protein